jgi:TetR/AcrR family transcriptional regulator, transcriptional repressor for nem operon
MPLSKQHKAQTRERILRGAGRVFRRVGFEAAGIDAVMAEAGLTRGGFYAHFGSKEELFASVVGTDHGLIRMLAAREAGNPAQWRTRTLKLLADYLHPDHLDEVSQGCSFAALTADASRGSPPVRAAYGRAFGELVAQLLRRHGESAEQATARANARQREAAAEVAVVATGALIIGAALGGSPAARAALAGAWATVRERMGG